MVEQVYYSIDREPDICARYIAQAIKAQPTRQEPSFRTAFHGDHGNDGTSFEEAINEMAGRVRRAWEEMIFQAFCGRKGL